MGRDYKHIGIEPCRKGDWVWWITLKNDVFTGQIIKYIDGCWCVKREDNDEIVYFEI